MNGNQGTKPSGRQCYGLLDAVVTIIEYKKSTIDHAIYINVFDDGTLSYLTVFTDDVLNTTNNKNSFPELTRVFKEHFEMKVKELSVLKYLNFRIFQSPLGLIIYQTDHITELVNEWFPTGKFRKFKYLRTDTFCTFISKCSLNTIVSSGNVFSLLVVLITSSVETVRWDTVPSAKKLM